MKLIIKVVQDPDTPRNLFRFADKTFNWIEGIRPLLRSSSLLIVRNAQVLDYTNTITPAGAHDDWVCFRNLKNLAQQTKLPNGDGAAILLPHYFHVGDLIVISTAATLTQDDLYGVTGLLQNRDLSNYM